jgi:hypothetical protein
VGEVFAPNPLGLYTRITETETRLEAVAARRGKEWTASGPALLMQVQLRLFEDGFPASIADTQVRLLASDYGATELRLADTAGMIAAPREFALGLNYPNPFNPTTTIPFRIPATAGLHPAPVRLDVFNALGQRIRSLVDEERVPGYYRVAWDGRDDGGQPAGNGLYFYRLAAGTHESSQKMLLLK